MEEIQVEEIEEVTQGDYIIFPTGKLGSLYGLSVAFSSTEGSYLRKFNEWDDVIAYIKFRMERDNWFTNVWFQDDHGGIQPVTLT